jgi:LTXXQ motif family protein
MMDGQGFGPGMMGNYGQGMMGGCPMMGTTTDGKISTFAEGRIAFLKAELGITDAQKSVWDAYAEKIKGNLQDMQGMWETMKTVFEAKTPVDRLDAQIAVMDSRLAKLKEIKPPLAKLYAALSSEQKKKADEVLTGMGCMM